LLLVQFDKQFLHMAQV